MKPLSGANRPVILLTVTNFVSYLTRNNFAAVVVEVADALTLSRTSLAVCFTCSLSPMVPDRSSAAGSVTIGCWATILALGTLLCLLCLPLWRKYLPAKDEDTE